MKTILAIWNSADKGKTDTLREFANLLLSTYPSYKLIYPIPLSIPPVYDFRLVVEVKGVIVGIESQGDPNTHLENRLFDLESKFNCDIILCTTRTRGDTVAAVDNLASKRGFEVIWTSTYQIDDPTKHSIVNKLKAEHILELFKGLSLL